MATNLKKWQRSQIRKALEWYRKAQEQNYYISNKRLVEVWGGLKAFSLLSPPRGSKAAERRVRLIAQNIVETNTVVSDDGTTIWGSRTPHFLTVAVTYRCQCDCRHCSAFTYRQKVAQEGGMLTTAEFKEAIRQSVDLGTTCVILSGGEPLLCDGLEELIASVDRSKSICTMFTNGEYLTEERAERLKEAGLFGVFVSLDSADPAEHDRNRGRPGLFHQAGQAIARCINAGLLTGVSTFITREKMLNGELDAMMDLSRDLGVIEVFLFDVIATGRLINQRHCMLTDDEAAEMRDLQRRYNLTKDYPRIIHQTMFTSMAYPCAAEGCPAGVAQIHLRGNGDIAPCDFTPYSFGNVRERPLEEIWREIMKNPAFATGSHGCRLADSRYWEALAKEAQAV